MRKVVGFRLLPMLLPLLGAPVVAHAQSVPPFSQTFAYPTGYQSGSSMTFNTSPFDTSIAFAPLVPPDNDCGTQPITTSLHFRGSDLHWLLSLALPDLLGFCLHSYTPTVESNCVFRLYGLALGDTANLRVRVVSSVAVVVDGSNGLERGRVGLSTNMGSDAQDFTHDMQRQPVTNVDTLEVPVRVLGNDQVLQFHLSMLNHVELLSSSGPRVEVTADASFLDVPPGMTVVNAYGYGSVVLEAPPASTHAGRLSARARGDGLEVLVRGALPGSVLSLHDVAGRRLAVARVVSASGEAAVELPTALRSGMYFVRCTDANGSRTARFVFAR